MGLSSKGFWCKVWEIEDKGKYTSLKITTSKKNKDNSYTKDYSGYVRAIGHAHNKAKEIHSGDSVHITDFELTNNYVKERNVTYTNVAVFEIDEIKSSNNQQQENTDWQNIPEQLSEPLPWE